MSSRVANRRKGIIDRGILIVILACGILAGLSLPLIQMLRKSSPQMERFMDWSQFILIQFFFLWAIISFWKAVKWSTDNCAASEWDPKKFFGLSRKFLERGILLPSALILPLIYTMIVVFVLGREWQVEMIFYTTDIAIISYMIPYIIIEGFMMAKPL